jgi:hypothetical protein
MLKVLIIVWKQHERLVTRAFVREYGEDESQKYFLFQTLRSLLKELLRVNNELITYKIMDKCDHTEPVRS